MALPPVGIASDVMIGTMYIKYKSQGWSERYVLGNTGGSAADPPSYSAAAAQMLECVNRRKFLLGASCIITWARVSKFRTKKDRVAVITSRVPPVALTGETGVVEAINDPKSGLLFASEDGVGHYGQRILRGVRDSWVEDWDLDASIYFPTAPVHTDSFIAATGGTYTPVQAVFNFWLWVCKNTVQTKLTPSDRTEFQLFTNASTIFRGVSSRDVGGPFGQSAGRAPTRT